MNRKDIKLENLSEILTETSEYLNSIYSTSQTFVGAKEYAEDCDEINSVIKEIIDSEHNALDN